MKPLNLPTYDVKQREGEVYCLVRKKWIALTPEEWVRQHFLHLMIQHLGYPKGMMRLEHTHQYFKHSKRSDITLFDKSSGLFLLVECKAPEVKLDEKVLRQISGYNKILQARYIAITNGLHHFIWEQKEGDYAQLSQFPAYTGQDPHVDF